MQITFDTTTITDDEVRGIFALLDTVRPEALASSEVDPAEATRDFNEWISEKAVKLTEETAKWVIGPSDTAVPPAEETAEVATHDANGLPWDERIHSGTKALNADGTWRTKRGVDKALVAEVEAELRATSPESLAAEDAEKYASHETVVHSDGSTTIPDSPTPPESVVYEPGAAEAESALKVVPPAPPAPEAPPAPSSAVSPFVALMKRVTTAQGAGKLTQPRVKELLESLDKKSIMDLRTDEDALASFAVLLDGEGV